MRKLNTLILAGALISVAACNIAEFFDDAEYRIANEVAFKKKEIVIEDSEAGIANAVYYANQPGRFRIIEEDCDWLALGAETFDHDDTLRIEYAKNDAFPRMARVEMCLDNNARRDTLTVKQESVGKPYLWLDEPMKAVYNKDGGAEVKLNTNIPFKDVETNTAYLDRSGEKWVESMDFNAESGMLKIRTKANSDPENTRTAIISMAYNKSFKDSIQIRLRLVQANASDAPVAITVTDLSAAETSNCYSIDKEGYYSFNALVRGNGVIPTGSKLTDATISGIADVKVLWESYNTDVTPAVGSIVTGVKYSEGRITFYGTGTPGNALIAASDASGRILWSWHIWSQENSIQNQKVGSYEFIDRNLGALTDYNLDPLAGGLFYQGMRKDPFPGVANFRSGTDFMATTNADSWSFNVMREDYDAFGVQYGTELGGIGHPMYFITNGTIADWLLEQSDFLWGAQGLGSTAIVKSIYDPCPVGYRMPSVTEIGPVKDALEAINGAYCGYLSNDKKLFYPACGRIDPETAVKSAKAYSTKTYGFYWLGNVSTGSTSNLLRYFGRTSTSSGKLTTSSGGRSRGHNIRCVKDVK